MFNIYNSNVMGVAANCLYPNKIEIKDEESLKMAVSKDYVCVAYKNNYRNNDNFLYSDCLPFDCDNDHSDETNDWITPSDVIAAFPGVEIGIHYSRNHMKDKGGKTARPKFHCLFPIRQITDAVEYANLKKRVSSLFPYFDRNAMDSARFFFGTEDANVMYVKGDINLTDFLDEEEEEFDKDIKSIKQGSRNNTMSRFASRILKRYGDTEDAYSAFLDEASKCVPPLEDSELKLIWSSAKKFYKKISSNPSYIQPSKYNDSNSYKPSDYTDVGQAVILTNYFSNELRYSPATHFLWFNSCYWKESEEGGQRVAQELTRRQLSEALSDMLKAKEEFEKLGTQIDIALKAGKKLEEQLSQEQLAALKKYRDALTYYQFVLKRRDSKYITAVLKEVKPMIEIDPKELNGNEFLLNTPSGTLDLKKGVSSLREHDPHDYITKCTSVSPSDRGKDLWLDCLNKIFAKDIELIDYVQQICGLAVIGKVYVEALIVAYGDGGNGKSTFWNSIFRVLGNYSGKISADTLTVGCKRNIKPEMAEINGRRLLIASESQEGARLNDSIVKQLCSTDEVNAEKKYKDPFYFTPCHTLVLYTNHLPRVSGNDDGIWRRLIVIPFNNKLTGSGDIKNYADYLCENAGEYILSWVIEGARKVINNGFHIETPKCVTNAIGTYREQNDWFHHFLEDCCEVGDKFTESSNALYSNYKRYCTDMSEYTRSTTDFYNALEKNGFTRFEKNRKRYFKGLKIKGDAFNDFEDFLN